ncbi:hypothetical protein [Microcoleus sp. AT3-D2]|uniref:hypothetical protein n=1 Tax=Microcoleus sp. AT3-D2 TaxID=2818612 RepID=UPI004040A290
MWTHKTHEKCADIYAAQLKALKTTEIVLSALTTTSLLTSIFVAQRWGIIIVLCYLHFFWGNYLCQRL